MRARFALQTAGCLGLGAMVALSVVWTHADEDKPSEEAVADSMPERLPPWERYKRLSASEREAHEAFAAMFKMLRGAGDAIQWRGPRKVLDETDGPAEVEVIVTGDKTLLNPDGVYRYVITTAEADRPSGSYWIGVPCLPVVPELRGQLDLPETQGLLVVRNPAPDSPAAKAGIKQQDILLKLDGRPLGTLEQLAKRVNKAKDQRELELTLLRSGERRTVKLKPAPCPGIEVRVLIRDEDFLRKLLNWDPKLSMKLGS